jgi:hypothetical protein
MFAGIDAKLVGACALRGKRPSDILLRGIFTASREAVPDDVRVYASARR